MNFAGPKVVRVLVELKPNSFFNGLFGRFLVVSLVIKYFRLNSKDPFEKCLAREAKYS